MEVIEDHIKAVNPLAPFNKTLRSDVCQSPHFGNWLIPSLVCQPLMLNHHAGMYYVHMCLYTVIYFTFILSMFYFLGRIKS